MPACSLGPLWVQRQLAMYSYSYSKLPLRVQLVALLPLLVQQLAELVELLLEIANLTILRDELLALNTVPAGCAGYSLSAPIS